MDRHQEKAMEVTKRISKSRKAGSIGSAFFLSQKSLATGIPQRYISEMENGKRPVGKEVGR